MTKAIRVQKNPWGGISPLNEQYAGARQEGAPLGDLPEHVKIPEGTSLSRAQQDYTWGQIKKLLDYKGAEQLFTDSRSSKVLKEMYPGWPLAMDSQTQYPAATDFEVGPPSPAAPSPQPTYEPGLVSEMLETQGLPRDHVKTFRRDYESPIGNPDAGGHWRDDTKEMWLSGDPAYKDFVTAWGLHEVEHGAAYKHNPRFRVGRDQFVKDKFGQQKDHYPPEIPGDFDRRAMLEGVNAKRKYGGEYPEFFRKKYPWLEGQGVSRLPNLANPPPESPGLFQRVYDTFGRYMKKEDKK